MKTFKKLGVFFIVFLILAGCAFTQNPSQSLPNEEYDALASTAKTLFDQATEEIILLASEDPRDVVHIILGDVEIYNVVMIKNEHVYFKTSAKFEDLQNYYAATFTGKALEWILSTKFTEAEGTLYCDIAGGATGWSISNTEVTILEQNDDIYKCKATFNVQNISDISYFTIQQTEDGYRVSEIDYIPNLLK